MSWRKKLEGPASAFAGAAVTIGLGAMGIDNNVQLERGRQLARDGIQTTAVVTEMRESGRRSRTYHVAYRYHVGGLNQRVEGKVDRDSYYALAEGMVMPVRFDAANPGRAITEGELARLESWGERFGPLGASLFMSMGFLSQAGSWVQGLRTRRHPGSPRKSKSPSSGSPRGGPGPRGSARGKRG